VARSFPVGCGGADAAAVQQGSLKLIDFNVGRALQEAAPLTPTGTRLYSAPEVVFGSSPCELSDVWAVGLCMHLLLSGRLPQGRDRCLELDQSLPDAAARPIVLNGPRWRDVSMDAKAVLRQCLAAEPHDRVPFVVLSGSSAWIAGKPIIDGDARMAAAAALAPAHEWKVVSGERRPRRSRSAALLSAWRARDATRGVQRRRAGSLGVQMRVGLGSTAAASVATDAAAAPASRGFQVLAKDALSITRRSSYITPASTRSGSPCSGEDSD